MWKFGFSYGVYLVSVSFFFLLFFPFSFSLHLLCLGASLLVATCSYLYLKCVAVINLPAALGALLCSCPRFSPVSSYPHQPAWALLFAACMAPRTSFFLLCSLSEQLVLRRCSSASAWAVFLWDVCWNDSYVDDFPFHLSRRNPTATNDFSFSCPPPFHSMHRCAILFSWSPFRAYRRSKMQSYFKWWGWAPFLFEYYPTT